MSKIKSIEILTVIGILIAIFTWLAPLENIGDSPFKNVFRKIFNQENNYEIISQPIKDNNKEDEEQTIIPTATPVPYDLFIHVSDSEGQPIEGAKITFGKSTIEETNPEGELIFKNLSENQGILQCFKQGYILINKDISLERGENEVNFELEQDPFGLQLSEVLAEGETIFFIEDFQDSKEDFDDVIGNWQVIEDPSEDGNMLIDVDQSESEIIAHVEFGTNCPSDVIFEYRFRYVDIVDFSGGKWQSAACDFRKDYALDMYPVQGGCVQIIDFKEDEWAFPVQIFNKTFAEDVWYHVRLEAIGSEVKVYINNVQIFNWKQAREEPVEYFSIVALDYSHIQFDDIVVKIPAE